MKRFLASLFLLGAILTGGAFAQSPNARSVLFSGGHSCPDQVRLTALPTDYQCPAVSLQLASGTAWVRGSGFVPLSSLLSITNASGGYVTDWSGAMTWKFGPVTNLVTSNDVSNNTYYIGTGIASRTGGQVDPSGGTTGTLVAENTSNSTHVVNGTASNQQTYVSGTTYVLSLSAKAGTAQYIQITHPAAAFTTPAYANFNLANCTVTASGGTIISSGAVAQGGGYCRIWIAGTATTSVTTAANNVVFVNNNPSAGRAPPYTGTGADVTTAFPQVEAITYPTQTSPSPYVATTSGTSTSTAQLRQANGTGLLVEESRTNLLQSSQTFNTTYWTASSTGVSATDNQTAAPDGTLTGSLVARTTTVASAFTQSNAATKPAVSGVPFTLSIYAKPATIDGYYGLRIQGAYPIRADALFNLNNCTLIGSAQTTFTNTSAAASWVGSYCKISVTTTPDAGTTSVTMVHGPAPASASVASWESASATLSNAYRWGIQFEQRAFPTSYCPTTGAAATCSNDYITATGPLLSLLTNGNQGSLLAQTRNTNPIAGNPRIIGSGGVVTLLGNNTTTGVISYNGTTAVNATLGTGSTSVGSRAAVTWSGSTVSVGGNGGTVTTNAAVSFAGLLSNAIIGCAVNSASSGVSLCINGSITLLNAWGSALPAALIPTMTAPQPVLVTDFANGIHRWNGYDLGAAALPSLFSVANSGGYCTTSAGLLVSFPSNTLRICSGTGLLPEDTRTNSILRSQQYENAAWTLTGGTVSADTTVAPDGTTTADTLTEDASNGAHSVSQSTSITSGSTYAAYVISKPSGRSWVRVSFGGGFSGTPSQRSVWCNISTGTLGTVGSSLSGGFVRPLSGGFYLCAGIATATSTVTGAINFAAQTADQELTYQGTGIAAMVLWGSQHEVGSFPSSYIPTTTVAVTRNFDNIQALGPVLNLLGTQGANSMVMAWQQNQYYASNAAPSRQYALVLTDSGLNRWAVYSGQNAAVAPQFLIGDGVSLQGLPPGAAVAAASSVKLAFRWSNTTADQAASLNGATAATAAKQFVGTVSAPFYIGNGAAASNSLNSPLGCMGFFPGGLTNAQLQAPGAC